MLTAKLKGNIINCYDGKYDKETLKCWSQKNILLCPVCEKEYEYCHGRVMPPYFRHKDKQECLYEYYEPETEEHIRGKIALYRWIQTLAGVTDVVLEGWIPETKQRPDVMFKFNGRQWVIEYQCVPIASEYIKRHELYQAAGINDIWILGLKNYKLDVSDFNNIIHSQYYKTIESYHNFYLDYKNLNVFVEGNLIHKNLSLNFVRIPIYNKFNLYDMEIDCSENFFYPKYELLRHMKLEDEKITEIKKQEEVKIKFIIDSIENINTELNSIFENRLSFSCRVPNNSYYIGKIKCEGKIFFIKINKCDYCTEEACSVVVGKGKRGGPRWGRGTKYVNHDSLQYDEFEPNVIIEFIKKYFEKELKRIKNNSQKISCIFKPYFDKPIVFLQTSENKKKYNFKFKFVKDFEISDEYLIDSFIRELKFLDSFEVSKYVFMIPSFYKDAYQHKERKEILEYFKLLGFTNVKFYEEGVDTL